MEVNSLGLISIENKYSGYLKGYKLTYKNKDGDNRTYEIVSRKNNIQSDSIGNKVKISKLKRRRSMSFKVLKYVQLNHFYNPDRSSNGGGYNQPYVEFIFNGIKGTFEDTSCGDFGTRYHLQWNNFSAYRDTVGGGNSYYSDFSSSNPEHVELLNKIYKLTGRYVRTWEDYAQEYQEMLDDIFGDLDINFMQPVAGSVLLNNIDVIVDSLESSGYIYWLDDYIQLNPNMMYELWLEDGRFGFRKVV